MKFSRLFSGLGVTLLAAFSVSAQSQPGNIAALEFQTPKNGMTKQYEEGRKQKVEWHKQQKDSQPLMVYETISGDSAGSYVIARFGQHWSDFDKPSVPDAADLEEYNKAIAPYVQSLVPRYYEFLSKVSNPPPPGAHDRFASVTNFRVRYGHGDDFRAVLNRMSDAAQKTKWPLRYEWFRLANGGPGGTFVLVIPRANWAAFEDNPDVKPFRDMLREAFGEAEAQELIGRLDTSVEGTYSDIVEFRPDLSYIPAK
ncbi:MAG: hypothetical protein WBP79_01600 [Candidatus Acidiferrales bacterium]